MQLDVKLQEPFSYNFIGLILLILLIVSFFIFIIVKIVKKNANKPKIQIVIPKNIPSIKNKYLKQIDELEKNVKNNQINDRKAYNELSSIIRKFINESVGIDVMKYSLNEIKTLKISSLTSLVEEYYEPEFSYEGEGDILSSIEKTKGVIETWK